MDAQENQRQYRIIDQLMTAHAVLRDRYHRRARTLNISIFSLAIALNGFVFATDDILKVIFPGHADAARIGLGITSIALLILSVVELRVNWEGQARSHIEALNRLGELKARFRECHADGNQHAYQQLSRDYALTMKELPPIPERSFAALKAYHTYKRLLSVEISKHPGVPQIILSTRLRWRAFQRLLTGGRANLGEH